MPLPPALDDLSASILPLAERVAHVHGDHNPKLRDLHRAVEAFDGSPEQLRRIRELADGYTAPAWACTSYRTLMRALEAFEESQRAL